MQRFSSVQPSDSLISAARRNLTTLWIGLTFLGTLAAAGSAAGFAGAALGIAVPIGICFGLLLALALGRVGQALIRWRLHVRAFVWGGAAADAEPVADFSVRRSTRHPLQSGPPPYVERNVTGEVRDGLERERFVILIGPRPSGKSRLIYEVVKDLPEAVFVSRRLSSATQDDPLMMLMADHVGFWGSDDHQTLVMRSATTRLLAERISGELIRDWLDRHPKVSVIATFNDNDLEQIAAAGEEGEEAFRDLKDQARVVTLAEELEGAELARARLLYPDLDEETLRGLPGYLCSAEPLGDRFTDSAEGEHALGHAIALAAADWARAGVSRPAPERYLRSAAPRYLPQGAEVEFEAELEWCTDSLDGAAGLLRRVEYEDDDPGYEADGIIRDLLDKVDRTLPAIAWEAIFDELVTSASETDLLGPIEDLIALEETTATREGPSFRDRLIALVPELPAYAQRRRLVDDLVTELGNGSVHSLIGTRVGDGLYRRLTSVQQLVEAPRPSAPPRARFLDRFLARFYVYRTLRAFGRLIFLLLIDVLSADLGFLAGFGFVLLVAEAPDADWSEALGKLLAAWGAIAVGLFALCGLYREDAPRAQLPAIILGASVLGFVGLTVAAEQRLVIGVALTAALIGTLVTIFAANWWRARYDRVSRRWVRDHGFEAQTLLIGSDEQAAAAGVALSDVSRPTKIVGHLTLRGPVGANSMGRVEDLPVIARRHHIGRVLILDPAMSAAERQDLADLCHAAGLLVEAVPAPPDLQSGGAEFILGQSTVLIRLEPLWQRSPGLFVKRASDLIIAALLLVILSPLLVATAIAVAIDCGKPIMVRSWRPGLGGKTFGMFRFRTNVEGLPGLFERSDYGDDQGSEGVTALGRRLRRHGIDELPQLLNVLLGQMSMVGPRPLPLIQHLELSEDDLRRYVVRPGTTGPWQVCGRTTLTYSELTKLDVAYLQQWSLFVDLAILAKTLRLMIVSRSRFPHLLERNDRALSESSSAP